MNPKSPKLQQQQKEATTEQTPSQLIEKEYASPEEMFREDAGQVHPPPGLAHRVAESIAKEPKPVRRWWRRWL